MVVHTYNPFVWRAKAGELGMKATLSHSETILETFFLKSKNPAVCFPLPPTQKQAVHACIIPIFVTIFEGP